MPLDSSNTIADYIASYNDNACYDEVGSVVKAKAFVTACRLLMQNLFLSQSQGGESASISITSIENALAEAQRWLAINDPNSTQRVRGYVTRADFRSFR